MSGQKSDNQLVLEDKLDLERTKIMLHARRWIRRQKNVVEAATRKKHWKELGQGKESPVAIENA